MGAMAGGGGAKGMGPAVRAEEGGPGLGVNGRGRHSGTGVGAPTGRGRRGGVQGRGAKGRRPGTGGEGEAAGQRLGVGVGVASEESVWRRWDYLRCGFRDLGEDANN